LLCHAQLPLGGFQELILAKAISQGGKLDNDGKSDLRLAALQSLDQIGVDGGHALVEFPTQCEDCGLPVRGGRAF
jgi:hypothetical protein